MEINQDTINQFLSLSDEELKKAFQSIAAALGMNECFAAARKLLQENLSKAKKDARWVRQVLRDNRAELKDTWLLTVDSNDRIYFCRKEI